MAKCARYEKPLHIDHRACLGRAIRGDRHFHGAQPVEPGSLGIAFVCDCVHEIAYQFEIRVIAPTHPLRAVGMVAVYVTLPAKRIYLT